MSNGSTTREFGSIELSQKSPVVAGSYVKLKFTYTVGALGMDDGAFLKIAMHQTSDRGEPQFDSPRADNYATVTTSGDATVTGKFDPDGHVRSYRYAIVVKVTDGALAPGETITVTMGETTRGSLGQQAQSFSEDNVRFIGLVDPHKTGDLVELEDEMSYDVVPGEASSLAAVVPTTVSPDDGLAVSVRAEDRWGNVASRYNGTVSVTSESGDITDQIELSSGIGRKTVAAPDSGVIRVTVTDPEKELQAESNPCVIDELDTDLYWGDIHGQTIETVGHRTVDQYFDHLANAAFLDFGSHAGNDFQISDGFWEDLKATVADYHDPDSFVTFLCSEWSAVTSLGGDHNIYYKDESAPVVRSSSWLIAEGTDKLEGIRPVSALYDHFKGRDDVLIIPHQGGRPATLDVVDPELTPFIEITSVWGEFEWFADEAMENGLHVGFVGGSDDHCGRPGTAPPDNLAKHNVSGGLLAAKTNTLDRDSLWEAFTSRAVYGTTGERIVLDVDIAGAAMGSVVKTSGSVPIDVSVFGTAPISGVDLIAGTEVIDSIEFDGGDSCVEIAWQGQREPVRSRDKVIDWSGGVSLSAGKIVRASEFGFDHVDDGIQRATEQVVTWDAYTTGNKQGVRLEVDAADSATLSVGTEPASLTVALSDIDENWVAAPGRDAGLSVRRCGYATDKDVSVSFDVPAPSEETPMYVRVRQNDGNRAWSSPVFVTPE